MILKFEIIYLAETGKGSIDHINEYYLNGEALVKPYEFAKDLPEDIRIFFKGATAELVNNEDNMIMTIRLPHRKPIKLEVLQEQEHEDEMYVEFIKNKLSLRFKFLPKFIEIYDKLSITKGEETIDFTPEDFDSKNNMFKYSKTGETIPWLQGYQIILFDEENVHIINPEKGFNFLLNGENPEAEIEDIYFNLFSTHTKILEFDPTDNSLKIYRVGNDIYENSFSDVDASYKLALAIEEQTPSTFEIIAKYMEDAAYLGSSDARLWLSEYRKRRINRKIKEV